MPYTPENLTRWTLPRYYAGATWEGYFVAPVSRNRDSDILTESNFDQQWEALSAHSADVPGVDESSPQIVREGHWLCGWVEWVAIHESNESALRAADKIAERIDRYPILNEDDFSRREDESAQKVWAECYNMKERIAYLRRHRNQFEFYSFADLLAVARGRYFNGYASELLA